MTEETLSNIIGFSFAFFFIFTIAIAMVWYKKYPRKRFKFRILEKKSPSGMFYKAQVKRVLFGWCGFYASTNEDKIWHSNGWDRKYEKVMENIKNYAFLCGLKLENVVIDDKTTHENNS